VGLVGYIYPAVTRNGDTKIRPTNRLKWIAGLGVALRSIDAKQSDPYSWLAKTVDGYVFTAEIDHEDQPRNKFSHLDGTFNKSIKPTSKTGGDSPARIRHALALFDAVADAHSTQAKCQLLIVKGTKYGTTKGGIRAAVDGDSWVVTKLAGDVPNGFHFRLERTQ
jgi:hypothetical protein